MCRVRIREPTTPEDVWKNYWSEFKAENKWTWNYGAQQVWHLLSRVMGDVSGKTVVECGSGTGLVSLRIARAGGRVILIDISNQALRLSKLTFATNEKVADADYICASIFALPLRDSHFDVVWSAGVIEHFCLEDQRLLLKEAWSRIKEGGKLIVIAPNRDAAFYNVLRIISMKVGWWPYGYENPLSRKDFMKLHDTKPKLMLSRGFLQQFGVAPLPLLGKIIKFLKLRADTQPKRPQKRWLQLPGYLLMALWIKTMNQSAFTRSST